MKKRSPNKRHGVVTVEFAIVAPILFMFILAGIEFSRANMIRNSMQNAAYEGARAGILPGATTAECVTAAQAGLNVIGISNSTVTVTPANLGTATDVTVNITVPMDSTNGYVVPNFFVGKSASTSLTLARE